MKGMVLNIDGLNIGNASSGTRSVSEAFIAPKADTEPASSKTEAVDKVSISEAGRAAHKLDVGRSMGEKQEKVAEAAEQSEVGPASIVDKQIERIKERIEELKLALKDLQGDKSEAADKKREMINAEILQLSGMLIELYVEKAKKEGFE
jgi:vacuolar-type H+-ATPase subunit I/STV1